MKNIIDSAYEHGIDAIIASDMSAISYGKQVGIAVHASTQLNISNTQAVRFFAEYCDVMVLARELSLEQVAAIKKSIDDDNITGPEGKKIKLEIR